MVIFSKLTSALTLDTTEQTRPCPIQDDSHTGNKISLPIVDGRGCDLHVSGHLDGELEICHGVNKDAETPSQPGWLRPDGNMSEAVKHAFVLRHVARNRYN